MVLGIRSAPPCIAGLWSCLAKCSFYAACLIVSHPHTAVRCRGCLQCMFGHITIAEQLFNTLRDILALKKN